MSGFIQGIARHQSTFLPEILDDYISEENLPGYIPDSN
jgi:hypothetical protein